MAWVLVGNTFWGIILIDNFLTADNVAASIKSTAINAAASNATPATSTFTPTTYHLVCQPLLLIRAKEVSGELLDYLMKNQMNMNHIFYYPLIEYPECYLTLFFISLDNYCSMLSKTSL